MSLKTIETNGYPVLVTSELEEIGDYSQLVYPRSSRGKLPYLTSVVCLMNTEEKDLKSFFGIAGNHDKLRDALKLEYPGIQVIAKAQLIIDQTADRITSASVFPEPDMPRYITEKGVIRYLFKNISRDFLNPGIVFIFWDKHLNSGRNFDYCPESRIIRAVTVPSDKEDKPTALCGGYA